MKQILITIIVGIQFLSFSQRSLENYELFHSLKQDGQLMEFMVIPQEKQIKLKYKQTLTYYWYKTQKVIQTQGAASGQVLHGDFIAYYEHKQLAQKGKFDKGLKDGKWIYWYEDGKIKAIEYWKDGVLAGECYRYDKEGNEIYAYDKKMFKNELRKPDTTIVYSKWSNKYTRIITKGRDKTVEPYKNNRLDGKVKVYKADTLFSEKSYEKGVELVKTPVVKKETTTPAKKEKSAKKESVQKTKVKDSKNEKKENETTKDKKSFWDIFKRKAKKEN